jgi:putative hydrolase of the HAD superfamily
VRSGVAAVFFDAGHTLLYAHPSLGEAYAQVTARFGARVAPERIVEALRPIFAEEFGRRTETSDEGDRAMWVAITRRLREALDELRGVPFEPWFDALWDWFGSPEAWRLYDDALPALRALRERGIRTGVVSNWDSRLRRILDGLGLRPLLDFIVISAEVGVRKPDERIFRIALERAGCAPAEAVHVGDLYVEDVRGARAAGLRAVQIVRPGTPPLPDSAPGVERIPSLDALVKLLA